MNFLLSSHQSFAIDVRLIGQLPLPLRRCLLRFPFCLPLNNCAGLIFQIVKLSMQQAMVLAPSWCVRPISPVAKVTFEVTVPIFKNCSIFERPIGTVLTLVCITSLWAVTYRNSEICKVWLYKSHGLQAYKRNLSQAHNSYWRGTYHIHTS